jgi:hypothetical protein|tara:strand:- start:4074 stop:4388 length:315 start_codon:yes stop_codon:yes gene_type:complete
MLNLIIVLKPMIGKDYEDVKALVFEDIIAHILNPFGTLERQVKVPNRGDGRKGKIDLVLHTTEESIPIEIDRTTPRKKSIFKVSNYYSKNAYIIIKHPFNIIKV